jgi:hypothetical protein
MRKSHSLRLFIKLLPESLNPAAFNILLGFLLYFSIFYNSSRLYKFYIITHKNCMSCRFANLLLINMRMLA